MIKRVFSMMCLALLAAVVAIAQTPPPAEPQKPTTPSEQPGRSSEARGERTMTLTGCLQQATEGTGFILTNVTAGAKGTAGTPTPSEPGAPAAAPTASTYRLIGTGGQDLSKHVGHKVEVSGAITGRGAEPKGTAGATPEPGTPPSTTPPSTTPPSSAASPMAGGKSEPRLNVKAIKHVSETCP